MKGNCCKCKHGVEKIGAYTNTHYVECEFDQDAEELSMEELMYRIKHPDERCKYEKGTPIDGGVTFDD